MRQTAPHNQVKHIMCAREFISHNKTMTSASIQLKREKQDSGQGEYMAQLDRAENECGIRPKGAGSPHRTRC